MLNYFIDADFTAALGVGKLVTSLTMTVFYVLLYAIWRGYYREAKSRGLSTLILLLTVCRFALCALPQNGWLQNSSDMTWGIVRNVPFVAMGVITVLYLVVWYQEWMLAGLVTLSFACYMGVVLYARDKPMMGMLMIPKTICYICVIAIMLGRL